MRDNLSQSQMTVIREVFQKIPSHIEYDMMAHLKLRWLDMTLSLFVLFLVSFVANAFSALSGGGAGLLQFPALIWLGLPYGLALATHKAASVFLGLGALKQHCKHSLLERKLSWLILGAGIPGVMLGAWFILQTPEKWALLTLGGLTLGLGLYSIYKKTIGLTYEPKNRHGKALFIGCLGLFFVGILNGSITSGTGLFLTIWLIYWFGLDYQRAIAYTLVWCGIAWNGTGAVIMGALGSIQWDWMPVLIAGSLLGGYVGTRLAINKGNRWVKRAFEVTTIVSGLSIILKALY